MNDFSNMFGNTPGKSTATENPSASLNSVSLVSNPQSTALVPVKPKLPENIETIGQESTAKIGQMIDQVLEKVKTGETAGLANGVTDIISLINTVDMSKIDAESTGIFSRALNLVKQTRVKLIAQYENVNQQVARIATGLQVEQKAMQAENKWLEDLYQANLVEIRNLQGEKERLEVLAVEQNVYVEALRQSADGSMEHAQIISDEANALDRIEKHIDRLNRQVHLGMLAAPDYREQQRANIDLTGDFDDVISRMLPAWKRSLASALQASRQMKRANMKMAIADQTNLMMKSHAQLMSDTGVRTAQALQRSTVADTETLEFVQTKLIDRLQKVKQIETDGREKRKQDAVRIAASRDQLRLEMQSWGRPQQ
jgi:uncharacterized protein YaaN involved in tellurite resistance